jgi:hypothetical protein
MRFKSGFSEWLSNVYYDEDWSPLLNLVDFAVDENLQQRAAMLIDLALFDLALNSFQGVFGSTHGRSYEQNKKWAALEGTTDTAKLLFGTGAFTAYDNMSVVFFALSTYRMPQVIYEIAHDHRVMTNRQRMGHRVEDAQRWGLDFSDVESGMVFLSNEAYLHPKTARLTLHMFDEFDWWSNSFFQDFKPFRPLLKTLNRLNLLPWLARLLEKDVCRNIRDEANIYTYRTPDYMLSTAQDHRAGYGGDQHHIWQATLGPNAVCFTTHPVNRSAGTPNYWTGSGSLPRAAQVKNVVVTIYHISKAPGLYVTNNLYYTHAWLPKEQFDETAERNGWIFARKGHGYLALKPQQDYRWVGDFALGSETMSDAIAPRKESQLGMEGDDQFPQNEVISEGIKTIWICELGSTAEDGSFTDFLQKISAAEIHYGDLSVQYESPSQGRIEFGWTEPLMINGNHVQILDYPRYDNPYCQAEFWGTELEIALGRHWLLLDWDPGSRKLSAVV